MTSNGERKPEDDTLNEYFERILSEEVSRSKGPKLNQHDRLNLIRDQKIQIKLHVELMQKIMNAFPEKQKQQLAAGLTAMHGVVQRYLEAHDFNHEELDGAKNHLRLSVLAQTARIIAMIDAYPDFEMIKDFQSLSHSQLRQYFIDESKKWLT
jgi:cytoplasmic iron level regulating protein YaaA (DUF328/UPF0246 family)